MNDNGRVEVDVAWDGQLAGTVEIEGTNPDDWGWKSKGTLASRVIENTPGQLPNFLKYLTVEGELARILSVDAEQSQLIKKGLRFLCNLRMGITEKSLLSIVADEHSHHLDEYTKDAMFTGDISLPPSCFTDNPCAATAASCAEVGLSDAFACALEKCHEDPLTPKFSGMQLKMPMTLTQNTKTGNPELIIAQETPFTHILKFGKPQRMQETIPVAEWAGLELSQASGLDTCDHALIRLPRNHNYESDVFGLVVERFDIREVGETLDTGYFMADMCNIANIRPNASDSKTPDKYKTPVENMARAALVNSSAPEEDARILFRRVVFGYCLADMDMHLKNISMLSKINKATGDIKISMAPTYDAVPTRVYPDQEYKELDPLTGGHKTCYEPDDSFSLPINGKYKDITEEDFYAFAEAIGIDPGEAQDIIFDVAVSSVERAIEIAKNPPEVMKDHMTARFILWRIASEVADQVKSLTQMEYHNDLEGNYYTYKDYDTFCKNFEARDLCHDNTMEDHIFG